MELLLNQTDFLFFSKYIVFVETEKSVNFKEKWQDKILAEMFWWWKKNTGLKIQSKFLNNCFEFTWIFKKIS